MKGSRFLERQLIAAAMHRPDLLSQPVGVKDFESELGPVWKLMREMHSAGEPVDAVTVGDRLGDDWLYKLGSYDKDYGHLHVNGEYVARQVKERGLERRAANIATRFAEGKLDKAELIGQLKALELEKDLPAVTAYSALSELIDLMDSPPEAIPTGIERFDENFSGLHRGDLVTVLARPAVGKTAMAVSMARNIVEEKHPVLFYSGEMPATQILARFLAQEAGIPAYKFRSGKLSEEQWGKFADAGAEMRDCPLYICDPPVPKIEDLRAVLTRLKEVADIDVVFVDYLQRLQAPRKESFRLEQVYLAKSLKAMAREFDVCMVALAQAGRHVDQYEVQSYGQLPRMGDAAESSQAEMESDLLLTLARKDSLAMVSVEKNRNGPVGLVPMHFDGETMCFQNDAGYGEVRVGGA